MLKYRFKGSKSSVSTDTIACVGKICLYNRKLNIGIGRCPIQSKPYQNFSNSDVDNDSDMAFIAVWFYQALKETYLFLNRLKGQ